MYTNQNQYLAEISNGELPNIIGQAQFGGIQNHTYDIAINNVAYAFDKLEVGDGYAADYGPNYIEKYSIQLIFDASRCSSIYQNVNYVRPRCIIIYAIIKY